MRPTEPFISVHETPNDCAAHLCEQLVREIAIAVNAHGTCTIALAGGSTPRLLYEKLGKLAKNAIDWPKVNLIWGDERNVPATSPDSNYRMVKESLLDSLDTETMPQVLRIPTGDQDAAAAAMEYEEVIGSLRHGIDIVLLGIGDDAHTASLFPGTKALEVYDRMVIENWVEKLNTWRITLTFTAINAAAQVYFLVCGASKQTALKQIWDGERNISIYPSQGVAPKSGQLYWILDKAAYVQ
jgi:6-phosphogluconolactonase